jgi:hypothetical protein
VFASTHSVHPLAPEFCCEDGIKPVPPIAHRFVADLDTLLMKQVFDIAQRQRETDVNRHCKADALWAGLEVAERLALGHPTRLMGHHAPRQPELI